MMVRPGPLLKGMASFLPGARLWAERCAVSPARPAFYYYEVWLKHLSLASAHGLTAPPRVLVEIGPGPCLGTGAAALLAGTDEYHAIDIAPPVDIARCREQLNQTHTMLQQRRGGPNAGWPDYSHLLDDLGFPSHILTAALLERCLRPERVEAIERALTASDGRAGGITCRRAVSGRGENPVPAGAADFVLSHAVMAHVDNPAEMYAAMARWLKPEGMTSHQIDFSSMRLTRTWNGSWAVPEWQWRCLRGRRPYLINRQPLSIHLAQMDDAGLDLVDVITRSRPDGITRAQLAPRWRRLSEADMNCCSAFVIARKRS